MFYFSVTLVILADIFNIFKPNVDALDVIILILMNTFNGLNIAGRIRR